MKYRINSDRVAKDAIADKDFYAVLGFVAANGGECDVAAASTKLSIGEATFTMALGYWIGTGVLSPVASDDFSDKSATKELPFGSEGTKYVPETVHEIFHEKKERQVTKYSNSELADKIKSNKELDSLIDFCNRTTEKMLNFAEIGDITYLVEGVGLTTSMVMKIVDYFVAKGKKGIRYMTKAAISMFDEGITDDALLDEYLKKKNEYDSGEGFLRSLIGAGARSFTKREKVFVEKWFSELKLEKDLVKLAYERTVDKISTPSLSYMAKIIERWTELGYKTVGDVLNGESVKTQCPKGATSFSLEDFDEASLGNDSAENVDDSEMESFF